MSSEALADLVVLDLAQDVAGPYCAKLFADFGATVIKLEPTAGDRARGLAPLKEGAPEGEASGVFAYLNANKRSATLNLESPAARGLLRRLVTRADVLIESFAPGFLDELGVGYAELRTLQPELVLTSLSWFGQSGPYRDFAANDRIIHALTGVVQGMGTPEGPPLLPSGYENQFVAGTTGFIGSMGALHGRLAGLGGRHVDQSVFEAALCFTEVGGVAAQDRRVRPRRMGINRFPPTFPGGIYPCKDGWIGITALTPPQWKSFCALIELPELDSEEYSTSIKRIFAADALEARFGPRLLDRSADEWLERGQAVRIPFAPVPTMADLLRLPQLRERGAFAPVTHPDLGTFEVPTTPFRLLRTPARAGGPAPRLGEHTAEIYRELLHVDEPDLAELRRQGAL